MFFVIYVRNVTRFRPYVVCILLSCHDRRLPGAEHRRVKFGDGLERCKFFGEIVHHFKIWTWDLSWHGVAGTVWASDGTGFAFSAHMWLLNALVSVSYTHWISIHMAAASQIHFLSQARLNVAKKLITSMDYFVSIRESLFVTCCFWKVWRNSLKISSYLA